MLAIAIYLIFPTWISCTNFNDQFFRVRRDPVHVTNISSPTTNIGEQYTPIANAPIHPIITTPNAAIMNQMGPKGCPPGFLASNSSTQCFKIYKDVQRSWFDAKKKCKDEGLRAAKPSENVVVSLRKDILSEYGDGEVWVDGRGDGDNIVWLPGEPRVLGRNSRLWFPANPGSWVTTRHCLALVVWDSALKRHPGRVYGSANCSYKWYTLCEL